MAETAKLKHETVGRIRYYWSRASFSRRFEVVVDAPQDAVAERFLDIEQDSQGFRQRTVDVVVNPHDGTHDFDIRAKHLLPIGMYTSVKVRGHITYSRGYEQTVIHGDIRLGWWYCVILALIGPVLGVMATIAIGITGFEQPLVSLGLFYTCMILALINRDYNSLITRIRAVVNDAQRDHVAHQRMAEPDYTDRAECHVAYDAEDDPFEHMKQKRSDQQRADMRLLSRKDSARFTTKK